MLVSFSCREDEKELKYVDCVENRTHNYVHPYPKNTKITGVRLLNSHTRRNPSASNLGIYGS